MDKERARDLLKTLKEYYTKIMPNVIPLQREDEKGKNELIQALDIAIESLDENKRLKEERDYILEKAKTELKDNEWHTEQPQEDRQYLVTYYQECDLLIMCKWKNKQWYDTRGIALDNDRVVAWKKVEPYERKE